MEEAEVVKKIPELWMWAVGLIAASFFGKFGEKIFEATFNNIKDTMQRIVNIKIVFIS